MLTHPKKMNDVMSTPLIIVGGRILDPSQGLDFTGDLLIVQGKIAEVGTTKDIFDQPKHPYTRGLLNCLPKLSTRRERLTPIPGMIPSLIDPPVGCVFTPRCEHRMPVCPEMALAEIQISEEHLVACHLYSPAAPAQNRQESIRNA